MRIELFKKYMLREEPSSPDLVNISSIKKVMDEASKNYGKATEHTFSYGHTIEGALKKIARLEAGKSRVTTVQEYIAEVNNVYQKIKDVTWEL